MYATHCPVSCMPWGTCINWFVSYKVLIDNMTIIMMMCHREVAIT